MRNRILNFTAVLVLLFVFGIPNANTQIISVFDIDRLEPINEVFIIDHKYQHSAVSNKKGQVDISEFNKEDTLIIQHPSYIQRIISYNKVINSNKTIYLTESAVDLGEVLVMANKRIQPKEDVPNTMISFKSSEIKFQNPQTTADLLGSSGEVFIQKSQLGGGSPMIRGFSANRILIVVDGIRMNNAIFRSGNLQNVISIDPNMIELSEVVMGPGSVMYGSDALGGVMNFHTRNPKLSFQKDSMISNSTILTRYSSANQERTVHGYTNFGGEKWGALAGISASSFSHLRSGANRNNGYEKFGERNWYQSRLNGVDTITTNPDPNVQRNSGYDQLNLTGKVRYQPTKNIDLIYAAHFASTSNTPRYDRLVETRNGAPRSAEWYYGPQLWLNTNLTANFNIKNDAWDKSRIIIGYQQFEESRHDRRFNSNNLRSRTEKVDAYNLNVDFDKKIKEKHVLFYGIEGVYNTVNSEGISTNIITGVSSPEASRYPDGGSYWMNAAAYLTWNYRASEKLKLSSGLRYTYIEMQSKFNDTSFYNLPFNEIRLSTSALNGSFIGFTYTPTKKWQLKLNTASGFRAPNIDDIAKVFDSEPGSVVVPNPNLKPEFTYDVDLSVARDLRNQGKIELIGFYTYLVNAMVRRDGSFNGNDSILYDGTMSQVQQITNASSSNIYGATINITTNISRRFGIIQTFTIMDGEEIETGNAIRHVPPAFGKTALRYRFKKIHAELFSLYNAWRHFGDLSPGEQGKTHIYTVNGTPAWATINARFNYKFNKYFSANLAVENILDKHYRPYSSGISAAGRNFVVTLRATI